MGKISRGFLGGFQGQLGTAYGCFWRLMDLIKAMPRKVKRPPTEAQLPARLRMALITSFLANLSKIIKIGFKNAAAPGQSAMNAAVSYNLNNAVTDTSPNYTIDFPELVISKGKLAGPYLVEVVIDAPAQVKFKWQQAAAGSQDAGNATDKATFIVFNAVKGRFVTLQGVVSRTALEYALQIPPDFSGDIVHCYMSFVSADGKEVSNSIYVTGIEVL